MHISKCLCGFIIPGALYQVVYYITVNRKVFSFFLKVARLIPGTQISGGVSSRMPDKKQQTHVDWESPWNTQERESNPKQQNANTIDWWRWRLECSNWRDTMVWHWNARTQSLNRILDAAFDQWSWSRIICPTWSLYWSWNMNWAATRTTPSNQQSSVFGRPDNRPLQYSSLESMRARKMACLEWILKYLLTDRIW